MSLSLALCETFCCFADSLFFNGRCGIDRDFLLGEGFAGRISRVSFGLFFEWFDEKDFFDLVKGAIVGL
jgi:hypothetical protein